MSSHNAFVQVCNDVNMRTMALSISYGNTPYGTYMKVHSKIHNTKVCCISKACLENKIHPK